MAEVRSIDLSEAQKPLLKELEDLIGKIEDETKTVIDSTSGEEISYRLMRRIELQHHEGRIVELATVIFEHCKGRAGEEAMLSEKVINAKQDIQRMWFAGKLAKWSALYEKAIRVVKALDNSIEGLRTILSREKELMKNMNQ